MMAGAVGVVFVLLAIHVLHSESITGKTLFIELLFPVNDFVRRSCRGKMGLRIGYV